MSQPLFSLSFEMTMARWCLIVACPAAMAAFTQAFLEAFSNLGLDPWAGIEMDVAWGHTTLRFGLHRPSVTGPLFVYRVCTSLRLATPSRTQVLSHADLSPDQLLGAIAGQFPDLRDTWTEGGWQLSAIDATRGHSRDRSLMHPCYILIHVDDYWAFNHRPHGLLELVLGSRELSFPCVLPQMINFPQLHIDQVVLADPQLLQVTAFVPGGDTLISSRSITVIERRDRVFAILDSKLRQRFPDMMYVGFLLLTAHPSSKWLDPAFCPQREKVVVVYSEEVLQGSASVLLRLSLPPHDAEGAIYVRRRLRLRYLIRQLGISPLCGDGGDDCLCYVNGLELTNEREMAVDDAAFIHCWGLPIEDPEEVELVTIENSTSQHSIDVSMPVQDGALPLPCARLRDSPTS